MTAFVHLRLHTEFSIVDGLVRLKPLMNRVAELGMPAVAVTDFSNFYGLVKAHKAGFGAGVQPIFAVDLKVMDADDPERAYPLCLLAMNEQGYKNLNEMLKEAYFTGRHFVPRIDDELLQAHHEGLIFLSGDLRGFNLTNAAYDALGRG